MNNCQTRFIKRSRYFRDIIFWNLGLILVSIFWLVQLTVSWEAFSVLIEKLHRGDFMSVVFVCTNVHSIEVESFFSLILH